MLNVKGQENLTTSGKKTCIKCSISTNSSRDLPCKHAICLDCVQDQVRDLGRTFGLKCPSCSNAPFTVTVVPQDRRKKQEGNKYVRDNYSIQFEKAEIRESFSLKSKIMGMTILGRSLFVVCKKPPHIIFKFDLDASAENFSKPIELSISEMKWPRGIAASEKQSCLYITDWAKMFGGKLWRYKYKKGVETQTEGPVAVLDVQPFGVSVSPKNDEVLVTCATPADVTRKRGWIYMYKSNNGNFEQVRTINLPDLEIPRHAVLTSSSLFIVCHGWMALKSHGVTSFQDVEAGELEVKSFYGRTTGGGSDETDMNCPLSLTIDKDGLILVADYYNNRIQLLTEDLQLVRHLLTKEKHSIEYPRHVCQDPSTGRLFVAQEDAKNSIQIFKGL